MDFSISADQRDICNAIRNACGEGLDSDVFEDDERETFSLDRWKTCGALGIPGLPVAQEYGGLGQSMLTTGLAIRALARHCRDEGLVFSLCAHLSTCVMPLQQFGTPEQKVRYLPLLASGQWIGGNGSTEAGAGSDVSSMKTRVEADQGGFVLTGAKIFVSNGVQANLLIIFGRHPGGMKMADISAFLVEGAVPGLSRGQVFSKMGLRTCSLCEIVLTGCRLAGDQLLGRERRGMNVFNASMLCERILMGAYHVGAMEQQFNLVLRHVTAREQFGKKLIEHSAVADMLVDMRLRIEHARLLMYRVCCAYDNGNASLADAAMLKLTASDAKLRNSLCAVHLFGAYGYLKESDVERQLRDSVAAPIYSGTSEIQRRIIAENLEIISE